MVRRKSRKNIKLIELVTTLIIIVLFIGLNYINNKFFNNSENTLSTQVANYNNIGEVPEYSGQAYVEINNNIPYFNEQDYTTTVFEEYSELDEKGRCGIAFANICKEIMPPKDAERGEIVGVKPTGWVQKRYDNLIKDKYLYNRCHLIGWQLAGENANEKNLITGTRYLNTEGMLTFENQVAQYIDKNENNHVLYRVTPIFEGNNLLASGVEIEAYSVEDKGQGVCFNVYCYNVQPGIIIDYSTGENYAEK